MDANRPYAAPPIPPEALVAHAGFVRRLAGAILRHDADADDASQEAIAVGIARGPTNDRARAAWLATIVRRVATRMRRSAARRAVREMHAARPLAAAAADDVAAREETLRAVVTAIRQLDGLSREAILLRHYDDLPPRVIAERLGVPVETVKSRLRRAHERLRVLLEQEGPERTEHRRTALAGFAGVSHLHPSPGKAPMAATTSGAITTSAGKAATIAVLFLLMAGGTVWVITGGEADKGGTHEETQVEQVRGSTPAEPALASRPSVAAAPPAPQVAHHAPQNWVRRTVGDLEISVPPEWVETATGPGQVAWTMTDRLVEATWGFEVRRRFDTAYFLRQGTILASGPLRMGDRAATWRTGVAKTQFGDTEYLLVSLEGSDDTVGGLDGSPPVFLALVRSPDRVAEHRGIFDQVLDSVRFPGIVGHVEGVELTEADVGKLRRAPAPPGAVRVLVVRDDRPLPGAIVELYDRGEDNPWTSGMTDDRGEILVLSGAARTARVGVRTGGTAEWWWPEGGNARAAELGSRLVCVLGRRSVGGRAFDASGRPLASGTVRIRPVSGPGWAARTHADSQGAFSFVDLPRGQYELAAFAQGTGPAAVPVRRESVLLWDNTARADLGSDSPDVPWKFEVRWRSGTPVRAGETLFLDRDQVSRMVPLGVNGGATVVLPPGTWEAHLLGADRTPVRVAASGEPGVTSWSIPGVRLAGTVRGVSAGEEVSVECRVEPGKPPQVARMSGSAFAVDGVLPGPHILIVHVGGRASDAREVVVPEDRDVADLVLDAPAPR